MHQLPDNLAIKAGHRSFLFVIAVAVLFIVCPSFQEHGEQWTMESHSIAASVFSGQRYVILMVIGVY